MANSMFSNDPFFTNNGIDDIFNEMMRGMNGVNSEQRYLVNGKEVSAEELAKMRQAAAQQPGQTPQGQQPKEEGILAKLGRNLTEAARNNELDPVIGRNDEIQKTAEILSRRIKNNPVLVGDAGVGKTAVVEG